MADAGKIMRTRSQAAGECDECDSYTANPVVNGCLLCDRCAALLPDPLGICHGVEHGEHMKLRTGRKLNVTLYIQMGDEPSDDDELLGTFLDPMRADLFVKIVNGESPPLGPAEIEVRAPS